MPGLGELVVFESTRDVQLAISVWLGTIWVILKLYLPRAQPLLYATPPARVALWAVFGGFLSSTMAYVIETWYYTHPVYEPLAAYSCHAAGMVIAATICWVLACHHPSFFLPEHKRGQTLMVYCSVALLAALPVSFALAFFAPHNVADVRVDLSAWGFAYRGVVAGSPAVAHAAMVYYMLIYERRRAPERASGLRSRSFAYAMGALLLLHVNLFVWPAIAWFDPSTLQAPTAAAERLLELPIFIVACLFALRAFLCGSSQSDAERRISGFRRLRDMTQNLEAKTRRFWCDQRLAPSRVGRQYEERLLVHTLKEAQVPPESHARARELYALVCMELDPGTSVTFTDIARCAGQLADHLREEPEQSPAQLLIIGHPMLDALEPALILLDPDTDGASLETDWAKATVLVLAQTRNLKVPAEIGSGDRKAVMLALAGMPHPVRA